MSNTGIRDAVSAAVNYLGEHPDDAHYTDSVATAVLESGLAVTVTGPDGGTHAFDIHPLQKRCLLEGLDDISLTQRYATEFNAFETRHRAAMPWLFASSSRLRSRKLRLFPSLR